MHFTDKPGMHCTPTLQLGLQNISFSNNLKFLGLLWDTKLLWKQHILNLKNKYLKAMNIIRTISANEWGGDQEGILRLSEHWCARDQITDQLCITLQLARRPRFWTLLPMRLWDSPQELSGSHLFSHCRFCAEKVVLIWEDSGRAWNTSIKCAVFLKTLALNI